MLHPSAPRRYKSNGGSIFFILFLSSAFGGCMSIRHWWRSCGSSWGKRKKTCLYKNILHTPEVTLGPNDESVGIPEIRWTGKWKGGCLWIIPGLAYCSPVESIPGEETDGFIGAGGFKNLIPDPIDFNHCPFRGVQSTHSPDHYQLDWYEVLRLYAIRLWPTGYVDCWTVWLASTGTSFSPQLIRIHAELMAMPNRTTPVMVIGQRIMHEQDYAKTTNPWSSSAHSLYGIFH